MNDRVYQQLLTIVINKNRYVYFFFLLVVLYLGIQVRLNNVGRNLINLDMEGFFDFPVFFQEEVNVGQILRNILLLSYFLFLSNAPPPLSNLF